MKPFKDWDRLIKLGGFNFKEKYPNTPYFKKLGLAGKPHLGKDILTPSGTLGYAPFNGLATKYKGVQAGIQVLFQPFGEGYTLRFAHLSSIITEGVVLEGTPLFYSGNSGTATTGPHTHLDRQIGIVYDFNKQTIENYRDPLEIDWNRPREDFYMRPGDKTVYADVAGKWVAVAYDFVQFLKDWPRANIVQLMEIDFSTKPIARPVIK